MMLEIRVRQSESCCKNVSFVNVLERQFLYIELILSIDCFPGQKIRKRNLVKLESAVFSFFTNGNSGVHKGVVRVTLSWASNLG